MTDLPNQGNPPTGQESLLFFQDKGRRKYKVDMYEQNINFSLINC